MIPLTDLENILIENQIKKYKKDKTTSLVLKLDDKKIDLSKKDKTCELYADKGRHWPLVDDKLKQRPEISEKTTDVSSLILYSDNDK